MRETKGFCECVSECAFKSGKKEARKLSGYTEPKPKRWSLDNNMSKERRQVSSANKMMLRFVLCFFMHPNKSTTISVSETNEKNKIETKAKAKAKHIQKQIDVWLQTNK